MNLLEAEEAKPDIGFDKASKINKEESVPELNLLEAEKKPVPKLDKASKMKKKMPKAKTVKQIIKAKPVVVDKYHLSVHPQVE